MKKITTRAVSLAGALMLAAIPSVLQASPYASGCTNVGGNITFWLNEGGGNVTVTYDDGSTNLSYNGINTGTNLPVGPQTFSMGTHKGYAIQVYKVGSGTPSQISVDTSNFCQWNAPRGVGVNKNPKYGNFFGRIYVDQSTAGDSKGRGIYCLNSDTSEALGNGNTAAGTGIFSVSGSSSSPYHCRVDPDNGTLAVGDFSTADANVWIFSPDLTTSNALFQITGETAAVAAGQHGDMFGSPRLSGSLAQSNLTLWVMDGGLATPNAVHDPALTFGPGGGVGQYNNIYRYDIGAGPLPWTNGPNYAYNLGLSSIAELDGDVDIAPDGKIFGGFERANLSNPDIQILDPTGQNVIWTSWIDTDGNSDPWNGVFAAVGGAFAGVRVTSDDRYLFSVDIDNGITIANLTNGLPDDSTLFTIANPPNNPPGTYEDARGSDVDIADNIYVVSSGQGLMRIYSLGLTTTCITSNDITGTNGTFQLVLPPVTATVVATTNIASQNYVNNATPGIPIPGQVTFTLSTNYLPGPVVLNFLLTGSGTLNANYTIGTGTDPNGVVITTSNLIFPMGSYPGGGNWSASFYVTPTAIPVSGPTLTAGFTILGGAQNVAGTPAAATVNIMNTGPQLLFFTNNASIFGGGIGNTMNRSTPGDYAKFRIIRWGDLNGPGNSASSINQVSYTVTNFIYSGTAVFPTDYTAQAQRGDPAGDGVIQSPMDGTPGVVINPGDSTVIAVVGNPVRHVNINVPPVNVTINISGTNTVFPYTNSTSSEGYAYSVAGNTNSVGSVTNIVNIIEYDNAIGGEVVLWSDPLTNQYDSTNWTLAFAATNFASFPVPPVVLPNYINDETAKVSGGTNDFRVEFGVNTFNNDGVPQSPAMVQNGWDNALRMTVNKDGNDSTAGVNLFPQGVNFAGNYALRFSMYLSLESSANGNPYAGTYPFEFALFGVNASGTNCEWRTATSIPANPGYAAPTNVDGIWFAIDAGYGSITPADFDAFTSPALPNLGVGSDYQSSTALSQNGVFKSPPFASEEVGNAAGGEPVDQWVDVSVELTLHTNLNVFMNRSLVIPSFIYTNGGGNYIQGKPMLGYLDPNPNVSDESAYVYYSNVRIVELAPYIYAQPVSLIATQGANVSFSSSTWLGTPTISNTWYKANLTGAAVFPVQTNSASTTNITSMLLLSNVQVGTNYLVVASDPAGSETGAVASLEVIIGPTNQTVFAGTNSVQFVAIPSGPSAPSAYQWYANGVRLANSSHYAGATTSTLTITNAQLRDAATYTVDVTNAAGSVAESATLAVNAPSPVFSTVAISGTNTVLNFSTASPYDNTGSFTLQSCGVVNGTYTNVPGTALTGGNEIFQFTLPYLTNSAMFYRLVHN